MRVCLCLAVAAISLSVYGQDAVERRSDYLETLRAMTPKVEAFEAWLEATGELPPDFEAMPSIPWLPDPLEPYPPNSAPRIDSAAEWDAYRPELKRLFHHWVLGTMPPAPDSLDVKVITEDVQAHGTRRELEMRFGPDGKAKLWFELFIPPGDGPHPVFITQDNHRAWALIAMRRGYLSVVYAGSDSRDDTATFIDAYPEYDWSKLLRRAWAASRCIDYLEDVPEARMDQIAMTGHSRNGKMSLMAAAMDERITSVISSSSGTGGSNPMRLYGEPQFGEGIELITRNFTDWFHPRWRFFVGREDKLPVDLHQLIALSAPRSCLLSVAVNDGVESTWAVEHAYDSVKPIWELYGAEDKFRILWREAGHETWPTVINRFLDWTDAEFGRGEVAFPERYVYPIDWDGWAANAKRVTLSEYPKHETDVASRLARAAGISRSTIGDERGKMRAAIGDMLGDVPPGLTVPPTSYGEEPDHIEVQLRRNVAGRGLIKDDITFGEYLNGDVYYPADVKKDGAKIPAILWIHPQSNPTGYVAAYRRGEQAYRTLAQAGYAVFCFDQIGHGRRVEEAEHFYRDHPNWSILGKTLRDAEAALDVMETLPYIDADRINVVGYAQGAFVALHLMALDDRISRGFFAAPPQPFRQDTADLPSGGLARWGKYSMLVPRMGHFVGDESRLPYDLDDLLIACAPRDIHFVTQALDFDLDDEAFASTLEVARSVYSVFEAADKVRHMAVDGYNHFDPSMQAHVVEQLRAVVPSAYDMSKETP